MNIVIFGKGCARPRQVSLSAYSIAGIALLGLGILGGLGFTAGYIYSVHNGSGVSVDAVTSLADEVDSQRANIQSIRRENEDTLDALAIRIAQMNARIVRLDALGRRLTVMAELEEGEFDFDTPPALGGPEEPVAAGSNVAVPDVVEAMESLSLQLADREAQLGVLESMLMGQNLKERVHPQGRPVQKGWISSYYGKRTDPFTGKPANHTGIDFAGKLGYSVIAVADGVVTWSSKRYGYGQMVEINHGGGYSTRYAHNSENLVAVGDEVRKGQAVARMGETGRATGPNLHFEVLKDGRRVNPLSFIKDGSN